MHLNGDSLEWYFIKLPKSTINGEDEPVTPDEYSPNFSNKI